MLRKTLFEKALLENEGDEGTHHTLCVKSGEYTARYTKGKYVTDGDIDYNQYHQKISNKVFCKYWEKAGEYLDGKKTTSLYQVGQDTQLNIHVSVETELKWHQLLASCLFSPTTDTPLEKWTLRCCPNLRVSPEHPVFIAISPKEKSVLILGTGYGGEIKKSMFTVMNLLLPKHQTLPMHCSAILSPNQETTLLLGLSGTGKTTLSACDGFSIIGDDEHAWSSKGVFNLEGGCYAKLINLSQENEPQIYNALSHPCVMENVILKEKIPDFSDNSITDNIRAAYPLSNLKGHHKGLAPHPKNIIFLCCDLYGVIPAVSLLNEKQALEHFLIGYTAKVGSTEVNSLEKITPVSSPCFGHPFFPLPLKVYAKLFKQQLEKHKPKVWLINTGWHGGDYQTGERFSIQTTRSIVHHIIHHKIGNQTKQHPLLDLSYIPNIGRLHLDFDQKWKNSQRFSQGCASLEKIFNQAIAVTQD
jgi:phosphoenolpyruvate carboxykinase (ATP)